MTMRDPERREWIEALERALVPLVDSATGHRFHPPQIAKAEYRALGAAANEDPGARTVFDQYVIRLNVDPAEVVELLSGHPAIEPYAAGDGDRAVFVNMPSKGFRLELRALARHLTGCAIMRGPAGAAAHLERFLSLSAEGRVPGYDITVFRGLTMEGAIEIAPGLEIVSYHRAAERGLVRNEPPGPVNDMPDYAGMGALVLAREMTWGPCLGPPRGSRDPFSDALPRYRWLDGHPAGIVFDLISIVTSHRVQVLSMLNCAPQFVDLSPNFGPGSSTGFVHADHWTRKELTPDDGEELRGRLDEWARVRPGGACNARTRGEPFGRVHPAGRWAIRRAGPDPRRGHCP